MQESRFIEKNEDSWKALEKFNRRFVKSGGINNVNEQDVREFARLFRLASYHMAYAKTHFPGGLALPYLNRVVGVAHNYFYVRERGSLSDIKTYFTHTFPQAVRNTWRYWGMAMAFFVFGMFFAGFYVAGDTSRLQDIMPGMSAENFADGLLVDYSDEFDGLHWDEAFMTAFFMTNNTAVAFNAFVFGLTAGLGTIFILVYNGLIVGALYGFLHQGGADLLLFYSLILPHGVIELAAIFLSGGAGLMLGKGMLVPGKYTRKHSLILHAKKAVVLIPGMAVMMVIAAFIEGFFTPLNISPWLKLAFAALTFVGLVAYINPWKAMTNE